MTKNSEPEIQYQVADLIIDVGTCRVLAGDRELPIQKLSFDLLAALLRRAPNVLTTAEIMDEVWGDVVVAEETVTQRVKLLRDALGPDRRGIVLTVRGRGFRIDAPVEVIGADDDKSELSEPSRGGGHRPRLSVGRPYVLAAMAVVASLIGLYAYLVVENNRGGTNGSTALIAEPAERTIAVVPFLNSSGNLENESLKRCCMY